MGWTATRAITMPNWCRRTATSPSTSGCATCSASTPSCTSASTATSNGCRARAWRSRDACWPDAILGPLPHLYPFIVNDPGEGAQAKRRTQAVIIDHLMPPLTRAENYGPLQDLERQVDEYYEALTVDPRRARLLRKDDPGSRSSASSCMTELGLGGARRRRGGRRAAEPHRCVAVRTQGVADPRRPARVRPARRKGASGATRWLALARFPVGDGRDARAGLHRRRWPRDLVTRATPFDPLDAEWAAPWRGPARRCWRGYRRRPVAPPWRHARAAGNAGRCALLDERDGRRGTGRRATCRTCRPHRAGARPAAPGRCAPRLDACGARGTDAADARPRRPLRAARPERAPSRGRPDVLPTGRNFYSVDTARGARRARRGRWATCARPTC